MPKVNLLRAKPMGRALNSTDEELDRAAEITDADIDLAFTGATAEMRALVDAEEYDPDGDGGTR
jgi:hypothetical protein